MEPAVGRNASGHQFVSMRRAGRLVRPKIRRARSDTKAGLPYGAEARVPAHLLRSCGHWQAEIRGPKLFSVYESFAQYPSLSPATAKPITGSFVSRNLNRVSLSLAPLLQESHYDWR